MFLAETGSQKINIVNIKLIRYFKIVFQKNIKNIANFQCIT